MRCHCHILGPSGTLWLAILIHLGNLVLSGCYLEPSGPHCAASWAHLGTILGHLGPSVSHLGAILWPSWTTLGHHGARSAILRGIWPAQKATDSKPITCQPRSWIQSRTNHVYFQGALGSKSPCDHARFPYNTLRMPRGSPQ